MSNVLVGLIGLKGSGKDTVGDVLVDDYGFYKVAYADPIKTTVCEMLHLDVSEYDEFKRSEFSFRDSQIDGRDFVLGVGMMMREHDSTQFVRYVDSIIKKHENVVVTDVRFKNEVEHLKNLNGKLCEIDRNLTNSSSHVSEQLAGTGVADCVIDNSKTIEHLKHEIEKHFKTL